MSDNQPDKAMREGLNEELKQAIDENPEAIAGFIQRLDLTNELLDVVSLGTEAMDDDMVTSIVGTATRLGELANSASDPKTVKNLDKLLGALRDAGDPENVPDSTGTFSLLRQLMDEDVQRGLGFLIGLANSLGKSLK